MATAEALSDSAVSWAFLRDFASRCDDETLTVGQVIESFVLPRTKTPPSSYCSTLPTSQVGPATFYVSHCRTTRFSALVTALGHFLQGADPDSVFLWIDFFAVGAHALHHALPHASAMRAQSYHHSPMRPMRGLAHANPM